MSVRTTIYDQVLTELAAVLPNHSQIPNPYDLADNNETFLRQGYGVIVGPSVNTKEVVSCQKVEEASILVSITRQTFRSEMTVITTDKDLWEDQALIVAEAEKADNFGLSSSVASFRYESSSGVEQIREGFKFLKIDTTFSVKFFENI